ncbi:hypothetical protein ACFLSZ_06490 [Candidatus Bipolaricaulota bacterium]
MFYRFPSDEWIKDLSRLLNESESYESSTQSWEGDFLFEVQPDETFADTAYLFLGLHHGKSRMRRYLHYPMSGMLPIESAFPAGCGVK